MSALFKFKRDPAQNGGRTRNERNELSDFDEKRSFPFNERLSIEIRRTIRALKRNYQSIRRLCHE